MSIQHAGTLRATFEAMIRVRKDLRREPEESATAWRARVIRTVADEWGYAETSLPSYLNGARNPYYHEKHRRLFESVQRYGAMLTADGTIDHSKRGQGPNIAAFLRSHRNMRNGNGRADQK